MALSLGVSVGSMITIGTNALHVLDIEDGTKIKIQINADAEYTINDQERQEVLPDVFISCGVSSPTRGHRTSRLAIEAPRSIQIDRAGRHA